MKRQYYITIILVLVLFQTSVVSSGPKSIVPTEGYYHDNYINNPRDHSREFRTYVTSFDGDDDDITLGISEWVAYKIRKASADLGTSPREPSWFTNEELFSKGIALNDAVYKGSGYSRDHMCMKSLAWYIEVDAVYNTHAFLNACP